NEIPKPNQAIIDSRNATAFTGADLIAHTTRDAITHQTDATLCMGCHSTINPTGFSFENFDPLGKIRTQELIFDA
ncbi:DUF1588 domain-containing protein, partial [Vibrio parahaemolyticus]